MRMNKQHYPLDIKLAFLLFVLCLIAAISMQSNEAFAILVSNQ